MNDNKAIVMASVLGAAVLLLLVIILKPFSGFEREYPMAAVSGTAAAGLPGEKEGQGFSAHAGDKGTGSMAGSGSAVSGASGAVTDPADVSVTGIPLVHASGGTLETRIAVPEGFTRTEEKAGSLGVFLREYKLKKDGAPVLLYNKEKKANQQAHVAVFKLPLENEDLQQCADSVMRVYAEYFRSVDKYSRIEFSLTDDFKASYARWREGYRIAESGESYEWVDQAEFDGSDACFKKFMRIVFAYSGTYSLEMDSKKVKTEALRIGDIFINGGSPGHVVMVVDTATDPSGRKAFLLAQGFMPAQQFHVLKNPLHADDPWYYADEITYPFETPEYTFDKECLRRPQY
ncbi:MAG TPA: hypothetical protein DCP06_02120 [Lachnospiraceae bacterium]|nr:hypothetical protein [Lachnospiraceae bacterium]